MFLTPHNPVKTVRAEACRMRVMMVTSQKRVFLVLWWKTSMPRRTPKCPPAGEIMNSHFSGVLKAFLTAIALSKPVKLIIRR